MTVGTYQASARASFLGAKQSDLVAAVGFDTYARILEEAVAELRGQPIRTEHSCVRRPSRVFCTQVRHPQNH